MASLLEQHHALLRSGQQDAIGVQQIRLPVPEHSLLRDRIGLVRPDCSLAVMARSP
jgi:hypothetical protein